MALRATARLAGAGVRARPAVATALRAGTRVRGHAHGAAAAPAADSPSTSTVDPAEVRKFSALADQWWNDVSGPFAALHSMNAVRVPLIRRAFAAADASHAAATPLHGLSLLDMGCGGGILSEALARCGARVLGVDASAANIAVATAHAALDPARFGGDRLRYECTTAEELATRAMGSFDGVVLSEVVEHVADVPAFITAAVTLLKPDGRLVVTTLNRTALSFLVAILGAEYVLRLLPAGTHEWAKFITPDELAHHLATAGAPVVWRGGIGYNPLTARWYEGASTDVHYALIARKAARPWQAAVGGPAAAAEVLR